MKIKSFAISASMLLAAFMLTASAQEAWEPYQPLRRDGNVIETLKHRITIAPTGFPEQIVIKPHRTSLPLEFRDAAGQLSAGQLNELGRGPQLRAPVRLEALVQGNRTSAEVRTVAAAGNQTAGAVTYTSKLAVGALDVDVRNRIECDGAMTYEITFSGNAANTDILELVLDINGPVDFAYRGCQDLRPGSRRARGCDTASLS